MANHCRTISCGVLVLDICPNQRRAVACWNGPGLQVSGRLQKHPRREINSDTHTGRYREISLEGILTWWQPTNCPSMIMIGHRVTNQWAGGTSFVDEPTWQSIGTVGDLPIEDGDCPLSS